MLKSYLVVQTLHSSTKRKMKPAKILLALQGFSDDELPHSYLYISECGDIKAGRDWETLSNISLEINGILYLSSFPTKDAIVLLQSKGYKKIACFTSIPIPCFVPALPGYSIETIGISKADYCEEFLNFLEKLSS